MRNDRLRRTGYGQFNQVVVGLVAEVRTPAIVNARPLAGRQGDIEQFIAFSDTQATLPE
jgi:hypothetical protein